MAFHYIRSKSFLLDLASLLPLDLLQLKLGQQPLLRFPRFFKVSTQNIENMIGIKRFFRTFQVYRIIKFYYIVESRTVWPNLWRVVNLIHILLILAHWFGCFYFLLSEVEGFQVFRVSSKIILGQWQDLFSREIGFTHIVRETMPH